MLWNSSGSLIRNHLALRVVWFDGLFSVRRCTLTRRKADFVHMNTHLHERSHTRTLFVGTETGTKLSRLLRCVETSKAVWTRRSVCCCLRAVQGVQHQNSAREDGDHLLSDVCTRRSEACVAGNPRVSATDRDVRLGRDSPLSTYRSRS